MRQASLAILGLGEAGQYILREIIHLADQLGIIDEKANPQITREKIVIRVYLEKQNQRRKVIIQPVSAENPSTVNGGTKLDASAMINQIKSIAKGTENKRQTDLENVEERGEALNELLIKYTPVVSARYGIAAIRIDSDETTLDRVGKMTLDEIDKKGSTPPLPPGLSIIPKRGERTEVMDPVFNEKVTFIPNRGASGRSSAVYELLTNDDFESNAILMILGLKGGNGGLGTSHYYNLMIYRAILLIHGLISTGAGVAAAILQSIKENYPDLVDSRFIIDMAVIPAASEPNDAKLGRDPRKWKKMLEWDLGKIKQFLDEGVLSTSIVIDLDFAILQWARLVGLENMNEDGINAFHDFIITRTLRGEASKVYNKGEIEKVVSRLTGGTYTYANIKYQNVDPVIARSVEPILQVLTGRNIRFAVGGSHLDEGELKEFMSGYVAVPMVSDLATFNSYVKYIKCFDDSATCSIATLLLPVLHGMLAPIEAGMVDDLLVFINTKTFDILRQRFNYVPTNEDIKELLREIFGIYGRVLVMEAQSDMAVVIYALVEPGKYFTKVVENKGWGTIDATKAGFD